MNTLNAPLSFRLGQLSPALALATKVHLGFAEETLLGPIEVEAQAEEAAPPGGTTVDAATVQQLRPATSDTASLLRGVPGLNLNAAGGVSSLP